MKSAILPDVFSISGFVETTSETTESPLDAALAEVVVVRSACRAALADCVTVDVTSIDAAVSSRLAADASGATRQIVIARGDLVGGMAHRLARIADLNHHAIDLADECIERAGDLRHFGVAGRGQALDEISARSR